MKLICYTLDSEPPPIRPAPVQRGWMDRTPGEYAYRCLPLNIANAHGWDVLSSCSFVAVWDGGAGRDAIRIVSDAPAHRHPVSHFGSGVLTFHINGLFRTPPGYNLYVTGPVNRPKPGIAPLTGIVETDWAPYTFTMNWLFIDPSRPVAFGEGEPICTLFPLPRELVEQVEPEFRSIETAPELAAPHREWARQRRQFNTDLTLPDSPARDEGWQKAYFRGRMPDGSAGTEAHRTKIRVRAFADPATWSIRPARPEDAAAVCDVFLAARRRALPWLPELHTPASTLRYIADEVLPSARVWIAEADGTLVGFLALRGDLIEHLYVDAEHWRRGIGRALLGTAIEHGPARLRLFVFERNEAARRFYEVLGFRAVAFGDGSGNQEGLPDVEYERQP
jgi:RimJ/RimL family protein N-acetyltransferase